MLLNLDCLKHLYFIFCRFAHHCFQLSTNDQRAILVSRQARLLETLPLCLKIAEIVSFKMASEANYVYILSGHKFIKNATYAPFWRFFEPFSNNVRFWRKPRSFDIQIQTSLFSDVNTRVKKGHTCWLKFCSFWTLPRWISKLPIKTLLAQHFEYQAKISMHILAALDPTQCWFSPWYQP